MNQLSAPGIDQDFRSDIHSGVEALERRLGVEPNGPQAEAMLQAIASLLSDQLRSAGPASRPAVAGALALPGGLRESLGDAGWIASVPGAIKDELFAAIVGAQEALIAELAAGETPAMIGHAQSRLLESAASAHEQLGLAASLHVILRDAPRGTRSSLCESLAERFAPTDRQAALRLYWLAYGLSPDPAKARKIAQRMFKLGDLTSAGALIGSAGSETITPFIGELRLSASLRRSLPVIARGTGRSVEGDGRVAYVASSALPYKVVGYTVRTHNLLSALRAEDVGVDCYVRPGYPWDRPTVLADGPTPASTQRVDEVDYIYTRVEDITHQPEQFVDRMAAALETQFRAAKPRLVHAASNHRTALPALIAARRLSIPFVYELRGLWELTAATKIAWWEETERFALERSLELFVAQNADHVLTITRGLADELVAGGVSFDKVSILPNAVDPELFAPREPDQALRERLGLVDGDLVLVYCGSLTTYEGLDDLIEAVTSLNPVVPARLVIVGAGPYLETLRTLAGKSRFGSAVSFVGSVPPDEVQRYWSLADIVAVPRKPFEVCRVVSPLKPFEAMAMEKPVILSDLPASREIVRDGVTGLVCRAGDPSDLASTIARLAADPNLRRDLGRRAREWVVANNSWQMNAERLVDLYERLAPLGIPNAHAAISNWSEDRRY